MFRFVDSLSMVRRPHPLLSALGGEKCEKGRLRAELVTVLHDHSAGRLFMQLSNSAK